MSAGQGSNGGSPILGYMVAGLLSLAAVSLIAVLLGLALAPALFQKSAERRKGASHRFAVDPAMYLREDVALRIGRSVLSREGYDPEKWCVLGGSPSADPENRRDTRFFRSSDPRRGFLVFARRNGDRIDVREVHLELRDREVIAFLCLPK
jgi:hypothetical protein